MNIYHSENAFIIDIIQEVYNTKDVDEIKYRAKEDLLTELSRSEILDYINHSEDYEMISNSISMKEHFKEYE